MVTRENLLLEGEVATRILSSGVKVTVEALGKPPALLFEVRVGEKRKQLLGQAEVGSYLMGLADGVEAAEGRE